MDLLGLMDTLLEKILKQSPVTEHGLAQFLRARITLGRADRDVVSDSIVLDYERMVHGQVGSVLLEVAHRVAAMFDVP
jgi:hypothetical protein